MDSQKSTNLAERNNVTCYTSFKYVYWKKIAYKNHVESFAAINLKPTWDRPTKEIFQFIIAHINESFTVDVFQNQSRIISEQTGIKHVYHWYTE